MCECTIEYLTDEEWQKRHPEDAEKLPDMSEEEFKKRYPKFGMYREKQ